MAGPGVKMRPKAKAVAAKVDTGLRTKKSTAKSGALLGKKKPLKKKRSALKASHSQPPLRTSHHSDDYEPSISITSAAAAAHPHPSIDLSSHQLSQIPALTDRSRVESLILSRNFLSGTTLRIDPHLFALRVLDLSHNELSGLQGIELLVHLEVLNASHNRLGGSPFAEYLHYSTNLRVLDLGHNEIESLVGVGHLHLLTDLNVERNDLRDTESVYELASLRFLSSLTMRGNAGLLLVRNAAVYTATVRKLCPLLETLDGRTLAPDGGEKRTRNAYVPPSLTVSTVSSIHGDDAKSASIGFPGSREDSVDGYTVHKPPLHRPPPFPHYPGNAAAHTSHYAENAASDHFRGSAASHRQESASSSYAETDESEASDSGVRHRLENSVQHLETSVHRLENAVLHRSAAPETADKHTQVRLERKPELVLSLEAECTDLRKAVDDLNARWRVDRDALKRLREAERLWKVERKSLETDRKALETQTETLKSSLQNLKERLHTAEKSHSSAIRHSDAKLRTLGDQIAAAQSEMAKMRSESQRRERERERAEVEQRRWESRARKAAGEIDKAAEEAEKWKRLAKRIRRVFEKERQEKLDLVERLRVLESTPKKERERQGGREREGEGENETEKGRKAVGERESSPARRSVRSAEKDIAGPPSPDTVRLLSPVYERVQRDLSLLKSHLRTRSATTTPTANVSNGGKSVQRSQSASAVERRSRSFVPMKGNGETVWERLYSDSYRRDNLSETSGVSHRRSLSADGHRQSSFDSSVAGRSGRTVPQRRGRPRGRGGERERERRRQRDGDSVEESQASLEKLQALERVVDTAKALQQSLTAVESHMHSPPGSGDAESGGEREKPVERERDGERQTPKPPRSFERPVQSVAKDDRETPSQKRYHSILAKSLLASAGERERPPASQRARESERESGRAAQPPVAPTPPRTTTNPTSSAVESGHKALQYALEMKQWLHNELSTLSFTTQPPNSSFNASAVSETISQSPAAYSTLQAPLDSSGDDDGKAVERSLEASGAAMLETMSQSTLAEMSREFRSAVNTPLQSAKPAETPANVPPKPALHRLGDPTGSKNVSFAEPSDSSSIPEEDAEDRVVVAPHSSHAPTSPISARPISSLRHSHGAVETPKRAPEHDASAAQMVQQLSPVVDGMSLDELLLSYTVAHTDEDDAHDDRIAGFNLHSADGTALSPSRSRHSDFAAMSDGDDDVGNVSTGSAAMEAAILAEYRQMLDDERRRQGLIE